MDRIDSPDPVLPSRRHIRRLDRLFVTRGPVYFVTTCTAGRRPIFRDAEAAKLIMQSFATLRVACGWVIGRFVVMPDHVHFFCTPADDAGQAVSDLMRSWKGWTSRMIGRLGVEGPVWQSGFFDHVLRGSESYAAKWEYVRQNPVRAGLVRTAEEWPWQGEIDEIAI
jgi:REP element-mobilizing transposase RayT